MMPLLTGEGVWDPRRWGFCGEATMMLGVIIIRMLAAKETQIGFKFYVVPADKTPTWLIDQHV